MTLDRGVIIGRNLQVPEGYRGTEIPNLVKVNDPEMDVSSQHLAITLDFWNVVIRDLGSTNGTVVVSPSGQTQQLAPGKPQVLEPGSRVVLGGGQISFVFQATA